MSKLTGVRFVDRDKIVRYLLDPEHPTGAAKARFFGRFGFTLDAYEVLIDAIRLHPQNNSIVGVVETAFGTKSVVECHLVSPDGRNPCVRSVWFRDTETQIHRFVTAYPLPP